MKFQELPAMQRLAIAQALYKKIAEMVSTKEPESLRSEVDEQVKGFYAATGGKSYDIDINGKQVGTMTVNVAKESTSTVFDLADDTAFTRWLFDTDDGREACARYAYEHAEAFTKWLASDTGEIPDGVEVREVTVPKHIKNTTLRVDPGKVASALGNTLSPVVAGLLGGA